MVIVKNLCKGFQNNIKALDNISFHIKKGEAVGLIGANGAGKTTLIKLISGLLKPDSGFVRVFGDNPLGRTCKNRPFAGVVSGQQITVGYESGRFTTTIIQDNLTVEMNMKLVKAIYKISDEKYKAKLSELCELLDIGSFWEYRADRLSLGQRMRAEIAAVLLYEPELIILDEPFIGIDLPSKDAIRRILQSIAEAQSSTIILTTHSLEEIEKICQRVVLLDKGKMIFNGNLEHIKYFFANINTLTATLTDKIPDMQDFPVLKYTTENRKITIWYDSKIIGSRDLTSYILSQTKITDLLIKKPSVEEIIKKIYTEEAQ